jgi:hypothetical protein
VHVLKSDLVTSFAFVVPPFFDALERLRDDGWEFSGVVANADATFGLEWNKYVFTILYFVFYRKIEGRWRKSAWPVCIAAHPREDKSIYHVIFRAVSDELRRRNLPAMEQMGLDHFPGLEEVFLKTSPGKKASHGIGHLLKNLRKNQGSKKRKGTPGLRHRSINTVCYYVHLSSTLPTRAMFHVFWEKQLQRIEHVWLDRRWARYFRRQYLRSAAVNEAAFGATNLTHASWHFGCGGTHRRGHGPSQQPPEAGHAELKRGIGSVLELRPG